MVATKQQPVKIEIDDYIISEDCQEFTILWIENGKPRDITIDLEVFKSFLKQEYPHWVNSFKENCLTEMESEGWTTKEINWVEAFAELYDLPIGKERALVQFLTKYKF